MPSRAPGLSTVVASPVQLFRFSAATGNPHRIHYDTAYAQLEGYPDVLVQSHLIGAWLLDAIRANLEVPAELVRFSWSNRAPVLAGQTLEIRPVAQPVDDGQLTVGVEAVTADGAICATATATFTSPAGQ